MQQFTQRKDFPQHLPHNKSFFCLLCGATGVQKIVRDDNTFAYLCNQCNGMSERFLAWDPGMVQYFNNHGELVHGSAGVIVLNKHQEILLFKRVKYPFLWTIPAGHRDVGEDPQLSATRELMEETGIFAHELEEVFVGEIRGDSCVGGADIHFWHTYVYRLKSDVTPIIEAEEGMQWGWFAQHRIPKVTSPVMYLLSQPSIKNALATSETVLETDS